ncbi:MAG: S8 family peptidase [Caloramator sp.]|nr:S8 family peptidase [Caloramator sp.]
MRLFSFINKFDPSIKPFMRTISKKKIPVIVCFRDDAKPIKNKIIYNNGKIKYEYKYVKAISCELSPSFADKLSEMPEVPFICFDHKATLCLNNSSNVLGINHAKKFNLTGKGISIGIIDTGVFPHPDLTNSKNKIVYFNDLINGYLKPYDDNGHGTFISGCIASSGFMSNNFYSGIAPDASICMVKAFDSSGHGFMSDIIKALDILLSVKDKYNIKVICLPFEFPYLNDIKINPLKEIIKKAIEMNITVVAPSGNLGPQPYSIYFPGNMKEVITVGGVVCSNNTLKNFTVSYFSGRGPLLDGSSKPDIIAPCSNITSLSSNILYTPLGKNNIDIKNPYISMSGTSISCALISGICALILEKTPNLTPSDLKSIICLSSLSIGDNKYSQGKGIFVFEKIIK